jgi:hypothetical protein
MRRWLYQMVLREAGRPEDLTGYLDRDTLIAVWPERHLPKGRASHAAARHLSWDGLMRVSDLHRQIAALALAAAGDPCGRRSGCRGSHRAPYVPMLWW